MKILYTLFLTFLLGTSVFAQSINNYKYVVVPQQYEFLDDVDEYQLNSLTIFLFKKYGFETYKEGLETPAFVYNEKCKTLYADVLDSSNFIRAKLQVILKDCNDKVVFTSEIGDSKSKEYKKAYHESLREAFISIEELEYSYNGATQEKSETITEKLEIQKPVEENEIPEAVKSVIAPAVTAVALSEQIVFKSDISDYRVVGMSDSYTVYDGAQKIGTATRDESDAFVVKTSQFEGSATISGSDFIIERVIPGVAGTVKMILTRE